MVLLKTSNPDRNGLLNTDGEFTMPNFHIYNISQRGSHMTADTRKSTKEIGERIRLMVAEQPSRPLFIRHYTAVFVSHIGSVSESGLKLSTISTTLSSL
jgi:hypothetical protein